MDKDLEKLEAEKKQKVVDQIVEKLSQQHPDLYYSSTNIIARQVHQCIKDRQHINHAQAELVDQLSVSDIQVLLSFH